MAQPVHNWAIDAAAAEALGTTPEETIVGMQALSLSVQSSSSEQLSSGSWVDGDFTSLDLSLDGTQTTNPETFHTWLHYGFTLAYPIPVQPVQGTTVTVSSLSTTIYHWFDVGLDLGHRTAGQGSRVSRNVVYEVVRDAGTGAGQRMTDLESDDPLTLGNERDYLLLCAMWLVAGFHGGRLLGENNDDYE